MKLCKWRRPCSIREARKIQVKTPLTCVVYQITDFYCILYLFMPIDYEAIPLGDSDDESRRYIHEDITEADGASSSTTNVTRHENSGSYTHGAKHTFSYLLELSEWNSHICGSCLSLLGMTGLLRAELMRIAVEGMKHVKHLLPIRLRG